MRSTVVDSSVESAMDEASGAGGTRGLATTGEGVEGSGGCVAPIKRAMRLRRISSMERVGVVMLVTVVTVVVSDVYPEIGSQISSILLFLGI